jgi:protein-S-isoprenylcysteine O-methyltransferase Ste14
VDTVITALATMLVPGVACFLVPYHILRATHQPLSRAVGPVQIAALPLAAAGIAMVVWVSFAFVRHGRGTPVPIAPPKHFVSHGLYRWVRNPMYVGALLMLIAVIIYYGSVEVLVYAAGLWAALHAFTVIFEEPQLRRRFGQTYQMYRGQVPRWIPRRPGGWRTSTRG